MQNLLSYFFRNFLSMTDFFIKSFRTAFELEIWSKFLEQILNAQSSVLNLAKMSS